MPAATGGLGNNQRAAPAVLVPFPDPVGQSAGVWQGVFRDEFDSLPSTAIWADHLLEGDAFRCNDNPTEVEWYPHNRAGLSVAGSILSLTARHEDPRNSGSVGYDPLCPATLPSGNAGTHTSGMIQSKPGFSWTYGYAEARLAMPSAGGTWPAFWTVAADGQWPSEIDIAEFDSPSSTYWRDAGGTAYGPVTPSSATWTSMHVFGLEWAAGSLKFYCDGTQYGTYANADVTALPQTLIFNLAVTGGTTGYPDSMQIDYVRVWNKIGCPIQPAITSLSPSNGVPSAGTVQVAFGAVSGATSYRVTSCPVDAQADGSPSTRHAQTGASSPLTVSGLTNADRYTFTVAALNATGYSIESLPVPAL